MVSIVLFSLIAGATSGWLYGHLFIKRMALVFLSSKQSLNDQEPLQKKNYMSITGLFLVNYVFLLGTLLLFHLLWHLNLSLCLVGFLITFLLKVYKDARTWA